MRMTSKGEVTIPEEIRERADLRPGDEVHFTFEDGKIVLHPGPRDEKPGPTRGERLVAAIAGTATANRDLSTDELMKLLRGDD